LKPVFTLIALSFLFSQPVTSQSNDTAIARIITNIRQLHELNPSEKCFLHTDKHFYQPGENIWFKTYLTVNDLPTPLSNVVYTDFSNLNGVVFSKNMWKAENSSAAGNIFIPDTLATGVYRIRSYTLWMLNEPSTINEQYIFVLGKKDQAKTYYLPETSFSVDFFPESGKLIESVENNLVFRVADLNGILLHEAKAELLDENNKVISTPVLMAGGIGLIKFTPGAEKKYFLQVSLNLNNKKSFELPSVYKNGLVLNVSNLSASKVFIQANASNQFADENKSIYVLAQQYGKTVFAQAFNFEDAQNATVVNKKNLSEGLMQVLAFNNRMQQIAERWIWVQTAADKQLKLFVDTLSFAKKGKNHLTITVNGTDIHDLSIAIMPADLPSYSFISHPDIFSYQLLHSNNHDPMVVQNNLANVATDLSGIYLDALMLTINPARFKNDAIQTGKQPPLSYFFETGISVRGIVKKEKESMQFDSSRIDIITKGADSSTTFSTARLDKKGAFAINDLHFRKQATIYLQATNKEKKKRKLEFELLPGYIDTLGNKIVHSAFHPPFKELTGAKAVNEQFVKNYSVSGLGKELTEIIIKGKTKEERRTDSLNKVLASDAFRESEFTKSPNPNFGYISFAQLFEQEFFGFRFNMGYARISGMGGTESTGMASSEIVSYYLNEQPISSEELNFINPQEVVLVKVNRNANLHLGQMGPGPSVLIYTVRKTYSRFGFDASTLAGYSIPLQFVNPDFSRDEIRNTEDRRTTLLWQPHVEFKNGKANLQFYNNDYTKKYKVVIQGIDKKGNLYYLEKIIE
jgi:hypothetical protein